MGIAGKNVKARLDLRTQEHLQAESEPAGGQAILTVLMLVGRLELYTVLAIFMPAFWRK